MIKGKRYLLKLIVIVQPSPNKRVLKNLLILLFLLLATPFAWNNFHSKSKEEHLIKNVPFYPQKKHQCGPASLASVLNFWGIQVSPEEIAKEIYSNSAKGTLGIDMAIYARSKGAFAEQIKGSWEELKNLIDADFPVIVSVDHGFFGIQANHFMVVVGYSEDGVIVNSEKNREKMEKKRKFLRAWGKNQYWMLLIKLEKIHH